MKKIIGLAGYQSVFLQRLADYVNGLGEAEAFLCTREEELSDEARRREAAVVFCIEHFAEGCCLPVPRVDFVPDEEREDGIYQYQPASELYKEMRKHIWKEAPRRVTNYGDKHIYAVYSPLGRSGKTSFACAYARVHSFFYIGMEEFGIKTNDFCDKGTLLYYIKNRKENITSWIRETAEEWEGITVLGTPSLFTDVRELGWDDYAWFLEQIRKDRGMGSVIFDFGSCCMTEFEILDLFDKVYLPVLPGVTEERKLKQFREMLFERNGLMEEKLSEIMVPALSFQEPDFMERVQYLDGLIYE